MILVQTKGWGGEVRLNSPLTKSYGIFSRTPSESMPIATKFKYLSNNKELVYNSHCVVVI